MRLTEVYFTETDDAEYDFLMDCLREKTEELTGKSRSSSVRKKTVSF